MEFTELTKLIAALVSAIGTIAVATYNLNQSKKIKADLLERFDEAKKNKNKHSVCELFRLIHGLRMTYEDIFRLTEDNHVIQIIYAIKKTPGMVTFKDGEFQFSEIFKNKYIKRADKISSKLFLYFFGTLLILSIILMVFGKGAWAILGLILIFIFSLLFVLQKNELSYNKMVEDIVEKQKNTKG